MGEANTLRKLVWIMLGALVLTVGCIGTDAGLNEAENEPAETSQASETRETSQAEPQPVQEEALGWMGGTCTADGAYMGLTKGLNHDQVALNEASLGHPFVASFSFDAGPHVSFAVAFFDEDGQFTDGEETMDSMAIEGTVPDDAHWAVFYSCGAVDVGVDFVVTPE